MMTTSDIRSAFASAETCPQSLDMRGYRIAAVLVAILLLLLPVLYLSLTVCLAFGWWQMVLNLGIVGRCFDMAKRNDSIVREWLAGPFSVAYVSLVVAIPVLLFFLLRPLLRRSREVSPLCEAPREAFPLLWELVDNVALAVEAPLPSTVKFDLSANASASRSKGATFRSEQLCVSLGLALCGSLSAAQLAGILAHELAHLSQRGGMRSMNLIHRLNQWLLGVAQQRGDWEVRLSRFCHRTPLNRVTVIPLCFAWILRGLVYTAQWLCLLCFGASRIISCRLLREMEYHADSYAARLVGAGVFALTMEDIHLADVASDRALGDAKLFWTERRLPDDLVKMSLWHMDSLPAEDRTAIERHIEESTTGAFDTHPAPRDRIRRFFVATEKSTLQLVGQATELFADFPETCKATTRRFYETTFGQMLPAATVVPSDQLIADRQSLLEETEALKAMVDDVTLVRPFALSASDGDAARITKEQDIQERATDVPTGYAQSAASLQNLRCNVIRLALASDLVSVGLCVNAPAFGLTEADAATISDALTNAEEACAAAEGRLALFESLVAAQLREAVLVSMRSKNTVVNLPISPHGHARDRLSRLTCLQNHLSSSTGGADAIGRRIGILQFLLQQIDTGDNDSRVQNLAVETAEALLSELRKFADSFRETPYPFAHAKKDASIAEYLVGDMESVHNAWDVAASAEAALTRYEFLWRRVLGRIALACS